MRTRAFCFRETGRCSKTLARGDADHSPVARPRRVESAPRAGDAEPISPQRTSSRFVLPFSAPLSCPNRDLPPSPHQLPHPSRRVYLCLCLDQADVLFKDRVGRCML